MLFDFVEICRKAKLLLSFDQLEAATKTPVWRGRFDLTYARARLER